MTNTYKSITNETDLINQFKENLQKEGVSPMKQTITGTQTVTQKAPLHVFVGGATDGERYAWAFSSYQNKKHVKTFKGSAVSPAASMNGLAGELAAIMRVMKLVKADQPVVFYATQQAEKLTTGEWQAKNPFVQQYVSFIADYRHQMQFRQAPNEAVKKVMVRTRFVAKTELV